MTESSTTTKNLSFSRREWLMSIAIIAVLEAWVLNVSYAFQSEQAVINYVSFAATIASLLLAVIAIIYGYFQADGQQKSAAAMIVQIESMRGVQKELNSASSGISNQLVGMTSTATELRKLSESLEGTHKTLGEIGGVISIVRADQSAMSEWVQKLNLNGNPVGETKAAHPADALAMKQDAVMRLFQQSSFDLDYFGFSLHKLVEKSGGKSKSWLEFVENHFEKPLRRPDDPNDIVRYQAIGFQALMAARAFGVIRFGEDADPSFTVSEDVFDQLRQAAESAATAKQTKDRVALIAATFV